MERLRSAFSIIRLCLCVSLVSTFSNCCAETIVESFSPGQPKVWQMPLAAPSRLETLTVTNRGSHPVTQVIVREANRDWSSSGAILDTILKDKHPADDREKALGIYQYVQDYIASEAYRSRYDCYDIWKAFNCYGMGHCEFHARLLAGLFEMAGLASLELNLALKSPPRFAHTICEVFFAGSWRLLDSHGHTFFLQRDNKTISSWDNLVADPLLLKRCRVPQYEYLGLFKNEEMVNKENQTEFFLTHKKSRGSKDDGPEHSLILRSGESFCFNRNGEGVFVNNFRAEDYIPINPTSKGILRTHFPASRVGWRNVTHSEGFTQDKEGSLSLPPGKKGSLAVDIQLPYPIVKGSVQVAFEVLDSSSELSLSAEKKEYPKVKPEVISNWKSPGKFSEKVDLDEIISRWNKPFVSYSYSIGLVASGKIRLISLELETVCEVAQSSLPRPTESPWIMSASGQLGESIEVKLETVPLPPEAETPQIIQEIQNITGEKTLTFSWLEPAVIKSKNIPSEQVQYDLVISDDSEFRWYLLPLMHLRKDISQTSFTIPREYLPDSGKHYWKVCTRLDGYEPSPWSSIGQVSYSKPSEK